MTPATFAVKGRAGALNFSERVTVRGHALAQQALFGQPELAGATCPPIVSRDDDLRRLDGVVIWRGGNI